MAHGGTLNKIRGLAHSALSVERIGQGLVDWTEAATIRVEIPNMMLTIPMLSALAGPTRQRFGILRKRENLTTGIRDLPL